MLDLDKEQTRELLMDIDQRLADRREAQLRIVSVVIGIGIVVALWITPGYWRMRNSFLPLPFLIDQWALMIGIAYGATKLLAFKFAARPRFPYIDGIGRLKPGAENY